MKRNIYSKIAGVVILFAVALLSFPSSVHAIFGIFGDVVEVVIDTEGMAGDIAEELEERYHLDLETIRDYGEGFNVSTNKGLVPEVSIIFSPSDPSEGERLTAKAFPIYFKNPTDQLYYTWYLKRDGCELGSASEAPEYCDADYDGSITVNDWKVSAMRILVTDGADPEGFDFDRGDSDSDGYEAEYGGEMEVNIRDEAKWCYVNDAETGRSLEFENGCFHAFPEPGDTGETGDGTFGRSEEEFWGSNPHDPDTADNGNKDEANAVGLGLDAFTWNYQIGDQVGVLVEGTSMTPTQHDDSSFMIMWAFSQNIRPKLTGSQRSAAKSLCGSGGGSSGSGSTEDNEGCTIGNVDRYFETVKGYSVCFLTTDISASDFDDCLEANLVDPLEGGQGSSKKLELTVSAVPQNPVNDQVENIAGDIVTVQASVDNADRSANEIKYTWSVGLGDNPVDGFTDVTEELLEADLVSTTEGNGLDSLRVALNMDSEFLDEAGDLADLDPIYMRVAVEVQENFGSRVARTGRSDVIVRVSNTDKKIVAYTADVSLTSGSPKLELGDDPICDAYYPTPASSAEASANLDRVACRLSQNEIIGLWVNGDGLDDFRWTINGISLRCSEAISDDSSCLAGNEVFFAVAGNPGETYSVRMDAVDVDTGKSVSLSRSFQIVQPEIVIESADTSQIWPRYVGSFTELDGSVVGDYSDEVFEMYTDSAIALLATTIPGYVTRRISSSEWSIDGYPVEGEFNQENGIFSLWYVPENPKTPDNSYFIRFSGTHAFSNEHRLALDTIFGIDVLQSSDTTLQREVRAKVVTREPFAAAEGEKRFFAAVSRYVPSFVLFAFRMFATAALILFTVGFVFSLMPDTPAVKTERRRYDM